jgi:hypothetical protein
MLQIIIWDEIVDDVRTIVAGKTDDAPALVYVLHSQ